MVLGSILYFIQALYTACLIHSFIQALVFSLPPPGKKNLTSIMQVAQWLVLSPWRKKVPSLNPLVIFAWSLYSNYSGFLLQSIDIHVRLTGVLKLVVGVNVSINDCVGLSVRLATFTGCTLLPSESWNRMQQPCDPWTGRKMDGCIYHVVCSVIT